MNNSKIKIAIIMGGPSAEREVSLNTGKNIFENLDKNKYEPVTIEILQDGKWQKGGKLLSIEEALKNIDIVFNAMHGEFGEDGTVQGLFESLKIPYTGSGVLASALGMNKFISRLIFREYGLKTPNSFFIDSTDKDEITEKINQAIKTFGLPIVIKPNNRGSSVGITLLKDRRDIKNAIDNVLKYDNQILIEKFIKGREMTCGVLELKDGNLIALPVTEIIPKDKYDFFDYNAKYLNGASDEITPANLSLHLSKEIQENAILAHKALGCKGYSRADFIISVNNQVYILEINTLPGMTKNSLMPKAAEAAGIEFKELLDIIIENVLVK